MKVDGGIGALAPGSGGGGLAAIGAAAKAQEEYGYDGLWSAETSHDPFFPLLIAAEHTERIELGTGIAVAFARSPMTLANTAWDLQGYSGGRCILGLGSQIKAHIEKRFSMPWSHPAARMRELVLAMRGDLGQLAGRDAAQVRGRVLPAHAHDPVLQPRTGRGRTPEGVPRGGRGEDDRGRGRGLRRHHPPRLHDRALRPRGHPPGPGAWMGEGGQDPRRLPAVGSVVRGHRRRRRADGQGARRHQAADRVLRLDPGVPRRARAARVG